MKNLLFTGASGFVGANIKPILSISYRYRTVGITEMDDYKVNLSVKVPDLKNRYNIVLHAAGKAHMVSTTEAEKKVFFDINLQGTKNLCYALEKAGTPESFIYISTVAVYGLESGESITEEYPLNGSNPYALSKILAEEYLKEWCISHNVKLGILRSSLMAGKNPPGNLGAMINGIKSGKYLRIGDGSARKSILMAEDIARLIPKLTEVGGIYNVCDNNHPSFKELEELISKQLDIKDPKSIPYGIAKSLAIVGDVFGNKFPINSNKLNKITKSLTFSNEKAKRELDWEPMDVLKNFIIN